KKTPFPQILNTYSAQLSVNLKQKDNVFNAPTLISLQKPFPKVPKECNFSNTSLYQSIKAIERGSLYSGITQSILKPSKIASVLAKGFKKRQENNQKSYCFSSSATEGFPTIKFLRKNIVQMIKSSSIYVHFQKKLSEEISFKIPY
ncbi:hypothetical protein IMG5_193140, partial [Ichthyophthirius multifiliis]